MKPKELNFWDFYKKFDKYFFIDEERTREEVAFLKKELSHSKSVIDFACGSGRISISLALNSKKVLGIDIDPEEIKLANTNSKDLKNISFEQGNYLKHKVTSKFDSAIFIYSSFGYYSDKTNLELLRNVNEALKSNGILILDLLNKSWAVNTSATRDLSERINLNEYKLESLIRIRKPILHNKYEKTIFKMADKYKNESQVTFKQRLYTLNEVSKLLSTAGFQIIKTYGSFKFEKYNETESKRLIIKAKKIN